MRKLPIPPVDVNPKVTVWSAETVVAGAGMVVRDPGMTVTKADAPAAGALPAP